VVKGYNPIMPTYQGRVSEEELVELILYIKSLGGDDAATSNSESTTATTSEGGE
jgi:cytochrome c oxidase subunit 2